MITIENKIYQNPKWLHHQYWDLKKSQLQIGEGIGISRYPIRYWMKKTKVSRRSSAKGGHLRHGNRVTLSPKSMEFINGELLGDNSIEKTSNYSARFTISSKHKNYLKWLLNKFENIGINSSHKIYKRERFSSLDKPFINASGHVDYHKSWIDFVCHTYSYEELLSLRKKWYPKGIKTIPEKIKFTPLTCRQWYIGDGSMCKNSSKFKLTSRTNSHITIATDGFTAKEVKFICRKLNELKINSHTMKAKKIRDKRIYISTDSVSDFLNYIGFCPKEIKDIYGYKWKP